MANPNPTDITYDEIHALVLRYMDHPFLKQNQFQQTVSRFHFDAIQIILMAADVPVTEARQVLAAVLLLHQGLSVHDTVDDATGTRRQLTVLAGDHDSGLYYWLLAQLNLGSLLVALCEGVVSVNEAKMTLLHDYPNIDDETKWKLQETIQGGLITAVAGHYLAPHGDWVPGIETMIRAFVVDQALNPSQSVAKSVSSWALTWLNQALERWLRLPPSRSLQPVISYISDYVRSIQHSLEKRIGVEGIPWA